MMSLKSILPVCLIFFAAMPLRATRYYVNQNASGANTGASWQDAFTDLQSALQVAEAGDTVWVAAGTYWPTPTTDRTISFRPRSGVALFGGFAGHETSVDQRDWETNATILSGEIGAPGFVDNSHHVLYYNEADANTILDGLVVTLGYAFSPVGGGGIALVDSSRTHICRLVVRNCQFLQNRAGNRGGGAIYAYGYAEDQTHFHNCLFEQNTSTIGGAVMIAADVLMTGSYTYCTFVNNEATSNSGGAFFAYGVPGFSHCSFVGNKSRTEGSAIFVWGNFVTKSIHIEDCLFSDNRISTATGTGGAVLMEFFNRFDSIFVTRCTFSNNAAVGTDATSLYIKTQPNTIPSLPHIQINSSTFSGDVSATGSTVVLRSSDPTSIRYVSFKKCVFSTQTANILEVRTSNNLSVLPPYSIVEIDSCLFEKHGTVLRANTFQGLEVNIRNSVFRGISGNHNLINKPPGIFKLSNSIIEDNSVLNLLELNGACTIENTIIRKNQTQAILRAPNAQVVFANCLLDSNHIAQDYVFPAALTTARVYNSAFLNNTGMPLCLPSNTKPHYAHCAFDSIPTNIPATATFGPGNLVGEDPAFVNPGAGNFRLQPCSPLANAGDNAHAPLLHDLDGLPRISGGRVDIGPYESFGPALADPPAVSPPCPDVSDGAIALSPIGGCAPYFFAWTHADGTTGEQLTGLPAGEYTITVTDSGKGFIELTASVPEPLAATGVAEPLECGGTTGGSAAVVVQTGTPPFVYAWADGSTDSLRMDLPIGTYLVTVSDANGCIVVSQSKVERSGGSLGVSVEVGEISCPGTQDGALTVLPTNGKAPYTWLWASGATTPTLAPLGPGTYLGTLTDALGCSIVWTLPFAEPDSVQALTTITNASDSLAATGSIHIQPFGGMAPYAIVWSTGASGFVLTDLLAGTYLFTITDARGCTQTGVAEVGITVGTKTPTQTVLIQAYPNPASHAVVLEGTWPRADTVRCLLFDALGKVVQVSEVVGTDRQMQVVMPVGHLADGVYTWLLQSGQWRSTGRFVKSR